MARAAHAAALLANRALAHEDWARERLAVHAGRKLSIVAGPAVVTLMVEADGSFSDTDGAPDLTLTIPPLRLPALLARPERWSELVAATGDPGLASTIGAQVAEAGRSLLALPGYAAERASASFGSYASDEAHLITGARAGAEFAAEVAALAARVDALGERVDRLAATTPAKKRR